jgi:hypothetical protein
MLRSSGDRVETPLRPWRRHLHRKQHGSVPYVLWSLAVIGLAAIAVAIVGALMPSGTRLEVLLSLLAGAGAGVVTIAAGLIAGLDPLSSAVLTRLFFAGSCAGAVVVAVVLAVVWRRRWDHAADVADDTSAVRDAPRPGARPANSARASGGVPPGHPPARRRGARALAG